MRTEVTYRERWPYSTNSLLPRIIGEAFSLPGVIGWSCACAWLAASSPNVTPPTNAAPPLRSSLRLVRSEPISPSFEKWHGDGIKSSLARGYAALPNPASAHEQRLAVFAAPTCFAVFLPGGAPEQGPTALVVMVRRERLWWQVAGSSPASEQAAAKARRTRETVDDPRRV